MKHYLRFIGSIIIFMSGVYGFSGDFTGDLGLGITATTGNTESSSFSITLKGEKGIGESKKWLVSGNYLKKEDDNTTTADSLDFFNKLEWKHGDKLFSYYEVGYLRDPFKDYKYRLTPGAGFGWNLVNNDKHVFKVHGGVSEVLIKYDTTDESESYGALAFGNQYKLKISDSADFSQSLNVNADFSDFERYFLNLEMSLSVMVNKTWGVKLTLLDKYDNMPNQPELEKNDMTFIAGVTFKIN